jgi:hypothetical protein
LRMLRKRSKAFACWEDAAAAAAAHASSQQASGGKG